MLGKKSYKIRNIEAVVNHGFISEKFERKESEYTNNVVNESQRQESQIRVVPYLSLFKYSTTCDKCYILGGIFLAIAGSIFLPVINILYGDFCNVMVDRQYPHEGPSSNTFLLQWFGGGKILENASAEERRIALEEDARAWGIGCAILSLFWFLFATLAVFLVNIAAARQILRMKLLFFKAVICQDMAWFDTKMDGNFVGKTADNLKKLENGIGGVIGIFIHLVSIFVVGVIMAFYYGWELTLAILSIIPVAIAIAVVAVKMQSKLVALELKGLTAAGKNAEEVFSCIRTVAAYGGEEKEVERYSRNLMISKVNGIKQGLVSGITDGFLWFLIYSSYSVAFGYGSRLIANSRENKDEIYTPATLLIIFYGIFSGLVNIAFVMIHLQTFAAACGAAGSIFDVIESKGLIQPCSDAGEVGEECKGEIEFKNVFFEYPARRSVQTVKGLNLKIKSGEIVAIIGESGSGKSTLLQLVQRLYDPLSGEVLLDGKNIKSLKVCWLRQQLGVVGQEPLLFSTTIRENILYGFAAATEDQIVEAAKKANAHDFITEQINGYETLIGQKGSTLSGGQKQRIAIARALIRDPKILLLDEATSALDATSEKIVQAALDKAAVGRTTLIVTHKLSTIANVDRIIVLSDGEVVEDGTPVDLYNARGKYYELLQSQAENIGESVKPESENKTNNLTDPPTISNDSLIFPPLRGNNKLGSLTASNLSFRKDIEKVEKLNRVKKIKFKEMLKWNKPEWGFLIVGALAALVAGAALPVVLILLGFFLGLLAEESISEALHEFDIYVISIFIVGCISGICVFLQIYCLTVAGMNLTERLRIKAFKSMIHQEMAWFDDEKNKVGALCLKLTQDPMRVQAGTGNRIGILMQAFSTAFISVVVSLIFTWKLTLVTLPTVPLVFIGAYLESFFGRKPRAILNLSMENSSKIAAEVIANIKVVAGFSKESYFIGKYTQAINEGKKSSFHLAWLQGLAFGFGQSGPFLCFAICLWYGGYLAANENLEYKYVMTVAEMLIFGTWTLGQCVVLLSSFREAKEAAEKLQYLFSRKPQISDGQLTNFPNLKENGILKFSKISFGYPTKYNTPVLENFNATVKAGQSVAVVGPSGSGKSTIVQLLLRFYDPDFGRISVNDRGTYEFKLSSLRQQFGLVSQEPVLFDRTVLENIAYGDNSRNVSALEVIEAAKLAKIHNFISSLPQGYETKLGISGAHLSGGQKQRIAIARALIRNPQILLLDEATSALDPQSESLVQETLDSATSGRTTITIAHRLGAVRNADLIYVLDKGRVQEYGTHQELMNRGGLYFSMHGEGENKNTQNDYEK